MAAADAELVRDYALRPVLAQHYTVEAAFHQKIMALSKRNETQARDIFDLKLLLDAGAGNRALPAPIKAEVTPAIGKAMNIGFDEFSGQVRAYLLPDYFDHYDRNVWDSTLR